MSYPVFLWFLEKSGAIKWFMQLKKKKSVKASGLAGSSMLRAQEEQVLQGDGEFRWVPFGFSKEASQDFLFFPALLSSGLHS